MTSSIAQRAAAAVDEERVISLTQELVRIRSVYEPERGGNEREVVSHLAEVLSAMGLNPILEEVAPGRPNLICDWQGAHFDARLHKTLMFEGHTDVVTEGDSSKWHHPPFEAIIAGDSLFGRGSADMKGGVAAALCALEAVKKTAPDLPGRIRLGIVVDEEGMMTGIKHFISRGWADDVSGAIICEPEENEICLQQKGAMRINVLVTGVMSHGAMPYAGVNPITALSELIRQVARWQQSEQERSGEHPFLGFPWITPTIVKAPPAGEAQHNVMPAQAYMALDVRTIPGQEHSTILADLTKIAEGLEKRTPQLTISLDCFESRPWTETPPDDPLVRAIEHVYPTVLGSSPRYGGVPGATDGTFLHASSGIPIVTLGPGDRTIPHQCDEYVRIPQLIQASRLYAAAAVTYLGPQEK